ncbi:Severin [Fasciola gigantica]|uniref:Severin n=1 Tax=Fasciola gigantica TaxID=46835 RepID=A0A504Z761_FASGI|nr:Severin [Fasciola gigantica]
MCILSLLGWSPMSSVMAGLTKPEEYSWKDTNVALFGSDEDRAVKKGSAENEPAWAAVKSVDSKTVMVWRVNKFKLETVKPQNHGRFFSGDSYVILKVDKVGNELVYDVFFWIGKDSTQDEYGTAAYKTVELDSLLDDKATQHREVDGFESDTFKKCFARLEKLDGGYESGFNKVKPNEFKKRLRVFHGVDINHVELSEVSFSRKALHSDDVFILDLGTKMYQWNGKNASKDERFRASQYLQFIEGDRNGRCVTIVIDEGDREGTAEFLSHLPDDPIHEKPKQEIGKKAIYRLSDESGKLDMSLVCEEILNKNAITDDDAYFIDTGSSLFVYLGNKCSRKEKHNALPWAHDYLKNTTHPLIPITVVSGGRKSKEMEKIWD